MRQRRETLKSSVMRNVLIALNYIENAHHALTLAIKDELNCNQTERNDLYEYGLSDLDIHKVKLANIKKSILSITGNRRLKELDEVEQLDNAA